MNTDQLLPMITILLLGAFHGLNPGMGWLFAVALGMQERHSRAVWRAMIPLTLGHALAIAVVVIAAALAGVAIPAAALKWPVAAMLVALGVYRLFRHAHPRGAGMSVGMGGLTLWSFLMATCHGAGLMVLPVFLGMTASAAGMSQHMHGASSHDLRTAMAATIVHGAGYLAVTAAAAWLVFAKLGLALLRTAWINVDLVWAVALIATGVLTIII